VQRPRTSQSTGSVAATFSITGRISPLDRARARGAPHHSGAKLAIAQDYEGHGVAPPEPHNYGLRHDIVDVAREAQKAVNSQLSLVRIDFQRRMLMLDKPICFSVNSSEKMRDEPYVEELCKEAATLLCLVNDLLVEQRQQPLGLIVEGHTSGPHRDGRHELAKARADKIESMLRMQLAVALNNGQALTSPPKSSVFNLNPTPAPPLSGMAWGVSLSDVLLARGYGSLRPLQGTLNADEDQPILENQRVELKLVDLPVKVLLKAKAEAEALAARPPGEAPSVEKQSSKRGARARHVAEPSDAATEPGAATSSVLDASLAASGAAPAADAHSGTDDAAGSAGDSGRTARADSHRSSQALAKGTEGVAGTGAAARTSSVRRLRVHVRGKTLTVACGEGKQTVYWLAITSVQRYLRMPDSYTSPFSHELTPLRVLARELPTLSAISRPSTVAAINETRRPASRSSVRLSSGADPLGDGTSVAPARTLSFGDTSFSHDEPQRWRWLSNGSKLCECDLVDDDHVWVDVGDGVPNGLISGKSGPGSRPFSAKPPGVVRDEREGEPVVRIERVGFTATVDPLAITGEQCFLDKTEQEPDLRPTLQFSQVQSTPGAYLVGDFATWLAKRKGDSGDALGADEGFDDFKALFDRISLVDLSGYSTWISDVRGVLWGRYDLLVYIFYMHGGQKGQALNKRGKATEKHGTISVLECWDFVRACALTSPTFGVNELDLIIPDHDMQRRKRLDLIHQPQSRVSLAEFIEMIVRVSLANQPDPLKPAKELKDALKDLFEFHIGPVYEQPISSTCLGDRGLEPLKPLDPSTRRMLRLHAPSLKQLFGQAALDDYTGYTIRLREVDRIFGQAKVYDVRPAEEGFTQTQLVQCFASMVLSGHSSLALEQWIKRHAPNLPSMPEPSRDTATGRGNLLAGGGLLQWEFDELVARAALLKFQGDATTSDQLKVNEFCHLLRVSMAPKRRNRHGNAAPPWLVAPPMEYAYDGAASGGARLTLPRPLDEAKANAERAIAVGQLLHVRKPPLKGDGKKDDKGGGKKKK